jgi:hypothetical protein
MPRDFFDPTPEQQTVVLTNAATLRKAERLIESCEHCNPEGAEIPFDAILDRVTGSDPRRITFWSSRRNARMDEGTAFPTRRNSSPRCWGSIGKPSQLLPAYLSVPVSSTINGGRLPSSMRKVWKR